MSLWLWTLCLPLLAAGCSAAREAQVVLRASTLREIGGVSKLDRLQYFNVHESTAWAQKDVDDFAHGLAASVGRTFSASYVMSQLTEDPQRPGFVNAQSLTRYCNGQPATLGSWPVGSVDLVTGAKPDQYYPGHATGFVPGSHQAAADFWERYAQSPCVLNASSQPRLIVEPMNECSVHAQDLGTNFTEMTQLHISIAERLHNKLAPGRALVGGPTSAFPGWQVNNFTDWKNSMGLFLDKAAASMDFISCHIYDEQAGVYPSNTADSFRSGSNMQAILDLHEAYSAARRHSGTPLPHLISEYGGGFKAKLTLPYLPVHDWHVLKGVIGKLHELLDRPDRVLKSIPFIVGYAEWFKEIGNASYPFTLWRKPHDQQGAYQPTSLRLFYELYAEVHGHRVSVSSSDANVQVQAFVNSTGSCWLLVNNLLQTETDVSIDWGELASLPKLQTIKRLAYDETEDSPVLSVEKDAVMTPKLALGPYEAVVLHLQTALPQPDAAASVQSVMAHYSVLTLVPSLAGVTHQFPVSLSAGATAASVTRVRVGFGGRLEAASHPPKITVNGQAWGYDAGASIGGHLNVATHTQEVFLLVDVQKPAGLPVLTGDNVIVGVTFELDLAITISSVVVITSDERHP